MFDDFRWCSLCCVCGWCCCLSDVVGVAVLGCCVVGLCCLTLLGAFCWLGLHCGALV